MIDEVTVHREGNQWIFSTGETLPVVSGASDPGPLNLPAPVADPSAPEPSPDSLAPDFLKNIPDADKAIVEKYVKEWDAGVTKKFQGIHEQYAPYKELGEISQVQAAIQLRELIENDPEYVYNMLKQEFDSQEQQNPTGPGGQPAKMPEFEGLPPQFVEQFQNQQTMLENLAQLVLESRHKETEQQEDAALEEYVSELKKTHGDFDEDFVLAKMWHGMSGEDAVKAYQSLTQEIINGREKPKPQPPGLFGGGVIPTDTPDVSKLTGKETRNMVAELLARAGQS